MIDRKIAGNSLYQILTKIITSGSGFIITILLARFYGIDVFGQFTKITTFVSLFYIVVDFGINAIFLKFDEKEARLSRLLGARILFSLLIIVAINLIVVLMPFNKALDTGFPPYERLGILIFSFTILNQAILLSASAVFQKKLRYDLYLYASAIGTILTVILIWSFAITKAPLEFIFIAYLLGGFISALLSLRFSKEKIIDSFLDKNFVFKILKESYPLGLMLFFNLIYFRIDTVILSIDKSTGDVALYGYAYKYFEFLLAIPLFISNAIYPFLLKSLKNLRNFYHLCHKYITIFVILSFLIAVSTWVASPLISVVRKDFIPSVGILKILSFSLPIFFATSILQWILIAKNEKNFLLKVYVSTALLNGLLNIIFIPEYSFNAAAIITGASESIICLLLLLRFSDLKMHDIK